MPKHPRLMRQPEKYAAIFPHAVFVCMDGGYLCAECLRENAKRIAAADPDCPDDRQWAVFAASTHGGFRHPQTATGEESCSHCRKVIG